MVNYILRHMCLLWLVTCNSVLLRAQEQLANPFEPLETATSAKSASGPIQADQSAPIGLEDEEAAATATEPTVQPTVDDGPPAASSPVEEVGDNPPVQPLPPEDEPAGAPILVAPRPTFLGLDFKHPYIIEWDGPITSYFANCIERGLEDARSQQADLVIIQLTSPGGELDTSIRMARMLQEVNWAKTIVWIPDEAISGGAMFALGAQAIFMRESATIGDAGPILLTPDGNMIHAEEKLVSYTAEVLRQLAEGSGRPTEIAAAMADRKLAVYPATEKTSGLATFLNRSQRENPAIANRFDIAAPIAEAGNDRFLTVGGRRARELLLCDELFDSRTSMLKQLTSVKPVAIQFDWQDRLAYVLNRPFLTALILIVGIVCLFFEFTIPGATVPGLISLLSFGAFFWSHILGGTAGGVEIVLFVVGAICLLLEVFVFPGFGVFGFAGLGLIALSVLMAMQDFLIPSTADQWNQFEGNGLALLAAGFVVAIIIVVQVFWLDSIPGIKRLQLEPATVAAASSAIAMHPAIHLQIGDRGVSTSDLRPSGKALIGDTPVDVLTEGDYVERDSAVVIVRIEGNIITVRKCD